MTIRSLWRRGAQWAATRVRPVRDPDAPLDRDAEFWAPTTTTDKTAPVLPVPPPPAPAWDPLTDTGAIPVLSPRPIGPRHAGHRPDPLADLDDRLEALWAESPIFAGLLVETGRLALTPPPPPVDPTPVHTDVLASIDAILEAAATAAPEDASRVATEAVR